jgi:hypothetical protein
MRRETERGEVIADFDTNGIDVRIVEQAPATSVCLRFIDPYGDTILNQMQLPTLISELEQLRESATEHDLRENIERMLVFSVPPKSPCLHSIDFLDFVLIFRATPVLTQRGTSNWLPGKTRAARLH